MTCLTWTRWRAALLFSGAIAALALIALMTGPLQAQARVFVSVGVPCCGGYWGPGPYWGYPPPYAYYPPPGYYPPPPGYYPPPAPTAAVPAAPGVPAAPAAPTAAMGQSPMGHPPITYTAKPAFTNSAGQTCREYKTNDGGRDVFGTACQQADGQWRVVN